MSENALLCNGSGSCRSLESLRSNGKMGMSPGRCTARRLHLSVPAGKAPPNGAMHRRQSHASGVCRLMPIRFQVDPDFYDHPKTLGMSDAAVALWVRAGSYSAAKLTDGFVADAALDVLSRTPTEAARELTRRGLWSRVKGGYRFHEWEARNLTRQRVDADREADRERKRRDREEARQNGKPQAEGHSVRPDGGPDSERSPNGIHPLSVSVSESVLVSVSGPPPPEPERQCRDHRDDPDPPPCRRCKQVRERWEAWDADRRKRVLDAPDCPLHAGLPAHNCGLCRSEVIGV